MRHRNALLVVSGAFVGAALAQQLPTFQTTVELVQLQVSVTDGDRRFVPGLRAGDFELRIDGVLRPVQVVYEVDLPAPTAAPSGSSTATDMPAAATTTTNEFTSLPVLARRHFLVLFDLRFTNFIGARKARDAAVEFVRERLHPSDLVGLAIIGRRGLELVHPFISDHERVAASLAGIQSRFASEQVRAAGDAISGLTDEVADRPAPGDVDPMALLQQMAMAAEVDAYAADVDAYLVQIRALADTLRAVRGRKHVIMFSAGFSDEALFGSMVAGAQGGGGFNAESAAGSPALMSELIKSGEIFQSADAVLYTVDTVRLSGFAAADPSVFRGGDTPMSSSFRLMGGAGQNDNSLEALADITGGQWYHNLVDFSVPLRRIEESTRSYYVVAYRRDDADPPSVRVDVSVNHPAVRRVAAPTRVTPPPAYEDMAEAQRAIQLAEALASPLDSHADIEMSMRPVTGGAAGVAAFTVNLSGAEIGRIAAMRGDSGVELEIGAFAIEETRIVDASGRSVRFEFEGLDRGMWFAQVLHAPAAGQMRLLLRDQQIGEPRYLRQEYRVSQSDRQEPRLLGPMLVGAYPTTDGVTPLLRPGGEVSLWLGATGLAATEQWNVVEIAVVLALEDAAGNVVRLTPTMAGKRSEGPYEERWVTTLLPAEVAPGPATLRAWVRSMGSEQIFSRSLSVTIEERR